jgi:hypothetical protein
VAVARRDDLCVREREANEPRWDASQSWEGWRALGPALAERYSAGLPPMPEWAWRPIGPAPGWVALEFVGPRMNAPIGAGVYLRKANGAILRIGSAVSSMEPSSQTMISPRPSRTFLRTPTRP